MTALAAFAKLLGLPTRLAEDALHSERAAFAVLSRRNLFAAGTAMAAGSLLVGGPLSLYCFYDGTTHWIAHSYADALDVIEEHEGPDSIDDIREFGLYEVPLRSKLSIMFDEAEDCIDDGSYGASRVMTVADWIRHQGHGMLCTENY